MSFPYCFLAREGLFFLPEVGVKGLAGTVSWAAEAETEARYCHVPFGVDSQQVSEDLREVLIVG